MSDQIDLKDKIIDAALKNINIELHNIYTVLQKKTAIYSHAVLLGKYN